MTKPIGPQVGSEKHPLTTGIDDPTKEVELTVIALIPEFNQVKLEDAEGRHYSLTDKTRGIQRCELRVGQRLHCTVTIRFPRVLQALVVP